jgi:hypothetical protein
MAARGEEFADGAIERDSGVGAGAALLRRTQARARAVLAAAGQEEEKATAALGEWTRRRRVRLFYRRRG